MKQFFVGLSLVISALWVMPVEIFASEIKLIPVDQYSLDHEYGHMSLYYNNHHVVDVDCMSFLNEVRFFEEDTLQYTLRVGNFQCESIMDYIAKSDSNIPLCLRLDAGKKFFTIEQKNCSVE